MPAVQHHIRRITRAEGLQLEIALPQLGMLPLLGMLTLRPSQSLVLFERRESSYADYVACRFYSDLASRLRVVVEKGQRRLVKHHIEREW